MWNESFSENFLLGMMGVPVVFLASVDATCSVRSVTGTLVPPSASVFHCHYHSNNAAHYILLYLLSEGRGGLSLGIF